MFTNDWLIECCLLLQVVQPRVLTPHHVDIAKYLSRLMSTNFSLSWSTVPSLTRHASRASQSLDSNLLPLLFFFFLLKLWKSSKDSRVFESFQTFIEGSGTCSKWARVSRLRSGLKHICNIFKCLTAALYVKDDPEWSRTTYNHVEFQCKKKNCSYFHMYMFLCARIWIQTEALRGCRCVSSWAVVWVLNLFCGNLFKRFLKCSCRKSLSRLYRKYEAKASELSLE